MKISIITACWNAAATIREAMESVFRQRTVRPDGERFEIEYLVVDGGSTDGTTDVIRDFGRTRCPPSPRRSDFTFRWISERDRGLYDAINKGIGMSTGDVIGICNADDELDGDDVLAKIAGAFGERRKEEGGRSKCGVDLVYGDVRFVRDGKLTRYCTGRFFRKWMFRFATFPAHPSTFVRRECFERFGLYSLDYRICADFEMMLRLIRKHGVRTRYLPLCTHVMQAGGMSTNGVRSNVEINREDLRALRANGYWSCLPLVYCKYPFKIFGVLFRNLYAGRRP